MSGVRPDGQTANNIYREEPGMCRDVLTPVGLFPACGLAPLPSLPWDEEIVL